MPDSIGPTPRNAALGALADALLSARTNTGAAGELVLGGIPDYVNNASYGDARLWRGGLQTGKFAPGAADVVLAAMPMGRPGKLTKAALEDELKAVTGMGFERFKTNLGAVEVRNQMRKAGNLAGPLEPDPYTGRAKELFDLIEGLGKKSSFLYHSTPAENLAGILEKGLIPNAPKRFADVSGDAVHFSTSPQGAKYFGGQDAQLLRLKKNTPVEDLAPDLLGGDGSYSTKQAIPPELLEALVNRKWVPLK